ncbi:MAG: hypothetical protein GXP62_02770 [Oligoflexia bacterium]|nr:hypothetical protein [Oligoflexia bacterium]
MASTKPLICPNCGDAIAVDDVNVARLVAICRGCGSAVDLAKDVLHRPATVERETPPEELMAMFKGPPGIEVQKGTEGLEIRRRWYHPSALALLLFSIFWDGFLVVWYAVAISGSLPGGPTAIMLLFPLIHVAAGVGITWTAVANLLNTTTITANDRQITVTHGPIPWSSPDPLPTARIDQLYLVSKRGNKRGVSYQVHARMQDGSSIKLLGGIRDDVQARYIEKRIEAYLGIEDRAIRGEYQG